MEKGKQRYGENTTGFKKSGKNEQGGKMAIIKGHVISRIAGGKEFKKFLLGKTLSRREAMRAKCYECNGEDESKTDCCVLSCPMYSYSLHKNKNGKKEKDKTKNAETTTGLQK